MKEIWKEVPNTNGIYYVSNLGRVKSYYAKDPEGRILRQIINKNKGYFTVGISLNGKQNKRFVHRLVAEAFCKKKDPTFEVDHVNGLRLDNRAENLEWVSHQENFRRSVALGTRRFLKPGQGSNLILNEQKVVAIKKGIRDGKYTVETASEKYGVSTHTIASIMKRHRWSHIP